MRMKEGRMVLSENDARQYPNSSLVLSVLDSRFKRAQQDPTDQEACKVRGRSRTCRNDTPSGEIGHDPVLYGEDDQSV